MPAKNFLAFLLICSTIRATSLASDVVDSSTCPEINLGNTYKAFQDPKISQLSDEHDFNTCYAATAARLLEAELERGKLLKNGETVSWLSLALTDDADSVFRKNNLKANGIGGSTLGVLEHAAHKPVCIQKSNAADITFGPLLTMQLQKAHNKYTSSLHSIQNQELASIGDPTENAKAEKLKNEFASRCWLDTAQYFSVNQIKSVMDTFSSNEFVAKLVAQNCKSEVAMSPYRVATVYRINNSKEKFPEFKEFIFTNLKRTKPVGADICGSFSKDKGPFKEGTVLTEIRDDCRSHSLAVIGTRKKTNLKSGKLRCQYRLLDSTGTRCPHSFCDNGEIWVDADDFMNNVRRLNAIK